MHNLPQRYKTTQDLIEAQVAVGRMDPDQLDALETSIQERRMTLRWLNVWGYQEGERVEWNTDSEEPRTGRVCGADEKGVIVNPEYGDGYIHFYRPQDRLVRKHLKANLSLLS